MKPILIPLAALVVASLSACATTTPMAAAAPPTSPPHGVKVETDSAYVARVEEIARRRGVTVQWVHPPSKRTRSSQ
jgi:hypothetical protein